MKRKNIGPIHCNVFSTVDLNAMQALSDKSRYELFARTVPPDTFQVRVF